MFILLVAIFLRMQYHQLEEKGPLSNLVKWYWSVESEDTLPQQQKIIPDGYPELIFHSGDPYEINLGDGWRTQGGTLLAGQLTKYFHLRNTGCSAMFAIKLQPWAIRTLFDISVTKLTDQVMDVPEGKFGLIDQLKVLAVANNTFEEKVEKSRAILSDITVDTSSQGHRAVQKILDTTGAVNIRKLADEVALSERSLERYFSEHIGLSPKRFSRIIRLAAIFKLITEEKPKWSEIAQKARFYDQSHFIKDFKEFTGEDPSDYGFDEKSMANFFLK